MASTSPRQDEIDYEYSIWLHPDPPRNPGDPEKHAFLFKNKDIQPAITKSFGGDKEEGRRFFPRKWTSAFKKCKIALRVDRPPDDKTVYSPLSRIERGKSDSAVNRLSGGLLHDD
jgi:hypothetical protein